MWLSNTACAAMMIPIACAVLKELDDHRKSIRQKNSGIPSGDNTFSLAPIHHGLSDIYPAPISTVFEKSGVNRCARVETRKKFPNFCMGVLQATQNCPQKRYFGWDDCCQCTGQMAQFWAIEIISGASGHHKDVIGLFVHEF